MAKRGNGEGSIYQRKKDKKWVAGLTLDNGKRKVLYGKTKLESVKEHRLGVLLLVVITMGMRRGELLALRWSDVDMEKGAVLTLLLSPMG